MGVPGPPVFCGVVSGPAGGLPCSVRQLPLNGSFGALLVGGVRYSGAGGAVTRVGERAEACGAGRRPVPAAVELSGPLETYPFHYKA